VRAYICSRRVTTTRTEAMPLYTYHCDHHGEFSAWGRMSESDAPQPCPSCTEPAPRALAHPAIGGAQAREADAAACGNGLCATDAAPMAGGGCCGGGACIH
jgi:putative FmdB family regulatory protein